MPAQTCKPNAKARLIDHPVIDSEGGTHWSPGATATNGVNQYHYVTIKNCYPEPLRKIIADLQSAPTKAR
ncbi:hypothetical protein CKA38_03210 [Ereboglobus luteus]|uniref:Uncharacterized protein n=1 Tax=Ereboglobus luteus TaxID=1796921 RepID=A0A2U8E0Q5_9BACT|nr:hypothetical protein CKA38_03210 [Ereboglobus luteus]